MARRLKEGEVAVPTCGPSYQAPESQYPHLTVFLEPHLASVCFMISKTPLSSWMSLVLARSPLFRCLVTQAPLLASEVKGSVTFYDIILHTQRSDSNLSGHFFHVSSSDTLTFLLWEIVNLTVSRL